MKKTTIALSTLLALTATGAGGIAHCSAGRIREIKKELSPSDPESLRRFAELRNGTGGNSLGGREPVLILPSQPAPEADSRKLKEYNPDKPWEAYDLTEEQWKKMDQIAREKLKGALDIAMTPEDLEKIKKAFEKFELTDEKIMDGLVITQARMIEAMQDPELRLLLADFSPDELKQMMIDSYTSFMGTLLGHFGNFTPSDPQSAEHSYDQQLSYFLDHVSEEQRQAIIAKLYDDSMAGKADRMAFGIAFADTFREMLRQYGVQYADAWWLQTADQGQGR